jgi:1-phosphatidylinositol-3-phosphate 5-kinase
LSQEKSYLKLLVNRISALKPDILLVSKSISRFAQEFLLEAKISVALNVKYCVLERLARMMEGDILSSASDQVLEPNLGTASHFYMKTFSGSFGQKPMMFFEGGHNSELGCTVLLRGASKEELKKVKKITLVKNFFFFYFFFLVCSLCVT